MAMNKTDEEHLKFIGEQIERSIEAFPDIDLDSMLGFYRLPEVLAILPMCKSTWYSGIQAGYFPKGACIGNNIRVWSKLEILTILREI